MSATPKTIQIFLTGGDPQGIRVAEITTAGSARSGEEERQVPPLLGVKVYLIVI